MRHKTPLLIILCLISASVIAPQFTNSTLPIESNQSQKGAATTNNVVATAEEGNTAPLTALVDTNAPELVEISNLNHLSDVYPLDTRKWPNDEISKQVIIPDFPESFGLADDKFYVNDIFSIIDLRVASNAQNVLDSIENPVRLGITKSLSAPGSGATNVLDDGDGPTSGSPTDAGDDTSTSQTNPTEDTEIIASNNDNTPEEQETYDDSTKQYLDPPTNITVEVPTPSGFILFAIGLLGLIYQQRKTNKMF